MIIVCLFVDAAALKAASQFSRTLSLNRQTAPAKSKWPSTKATRSLDNSASGVLASHGNGKASPSSNQIQPGSASSREIAVQTPVIHESLTNNKEKGIDIRHIKQKEKGSRVSVKDGCDNLSYVDENHKSKNERVHSAATSVSVASNENSITPATIEAVKTVKDKLANSHDSHSKLSAVDVS